MYLASLVAVYTQYIQYCSVGLRKLCSWNCGIIVAIPKIIRLKVMGIDYLARR